MVMSMAFMAAYREVKSSNQMSTVIQRSLISQIGICRIIAMAFFGLASFYLACDLDEEALQFLLKIYLHIIN